MDYDEFYVPDAEGDIPIERADVTASGGAARVLDEHGYEFIPSAMPHYAE